MVFPCQAEYVEINPSPSLSERSHPGQQPAKGSQEGGVPYKILIVDDNAAIVACCARLSNRNPNIKSAGRRKTAKSPSSKSRN